MREWLRKGDDGEGNMQSIHAESVKRLKSERYMKLCDCNKAVGGVEAESGPSESLDAGLGINTVFGHKGAETCTSGIRLLVKGFMSLSETGGRV
jgi:hypothetical protein